MLSGPGARMIITDAKKKMLATSKGIIRSTKYFGL
jgi:hypothetical protein